MQGKPNKLFWWVFGIHAAVIGGLLIAPLFHRRPKEIVTFVEFVSEPAPIEQPVIEQKAIVEKLIVDVPMPTNSPPKPKPKLKRPTEIKRSTKRVQLNPTPVTPTKKRITSTDIQNTLGSAGRTVDPHEAYYISVRERMYGVWLVPVGAAYGLKATGSITISPDGAVLNRRLTYPSGSPAFDQSVQSALNTVNRLPRPPADLPSRTITIEFAPQ